MIFSPELLELLFLIRMLFTRFALPNEELSAMAVLLFTNELYAILMG